MAPLASTEWLDQLVTLGAALPEVPGATVAVGHTVPGAPDGEAGYTMSFVDGRVRSATPGVGDAELVLTTKYPDLLAILDGDLDANAQFMSGRSKVAGPTGKLLSYLALTVDPAHREFHRALSAATDR